MFSGKRNDMLILPISNNLLLGLYVLAMLSINLITFLISDFYRKKFSQPSPRFGFITSMIIGLIFIISLIVMHTHGNKYHLLQSYLLIGSGVLSILSSAKLLITMKRVRK